MSWFTRLVMAGARNPLVSRTVTNTRPGRALAHRFVAGDDLPAAMGVALDLNETGMDVSLDLLGEEVHDRATAQGALDGYLAAVGEIARTGTRGNVSIKLSQLGLSFDREFAEEALDQLAGAASSAGTTVTVDMEDSRFTESTVELYEPAQKKHGNLGICLQAYLHRTPADLEKLAPLGGHIRLCKGAYVEPEEIAHQGRASVDASFAALLERLMAFSECRPAIATHDDSLIELARKLGDRRTAPWEYQMLYGVRPQLQKSLVAAGHTLRIYVPYGSDWYPYLTRRMAERPGNTMFFVRALMGRN